MANDHQPEQQEHHAAHTYGTKCRLAEVSRPWKQKQGDIPPVRPQYFYSSPISIEDPLSPSLIAGSAESKTTRGPLRPFPPGDNNAIERAWLTIADDEDRRRHRRALGFKDYISQVELPTAEAEALSRIVVALVARHSAAHDSPSRPHSPSTDNTPIPMCCLELAEETCDELDKTFCPFVQSRYRALQKENVIQEVMMRVRLPELDEVAAVSSSVRTRAHSLRSLVPIHDNDVSIRKRLGRDSVGSPAGGFVGSFSASPLSKSPTPLAIPIRPPTVDDGVTGKPFARMDSNHGTEHSAPSSFRSLESPVRPVIRNKRWSQHSVTELKDESRPATPRSKQISNPKEHATERDEHQDPQQKSVSNARQIPIEVPVGVSRLHMVSLPRLEMRPIYWSPVNDVAVVLRATWFYSETMVPVDPIVANQLEAGYHELQPYTETWNDELRCAVEVGPLGEEKVVHKLWSNSQTKDGSDPEPEISRDPSCAARCYRGEASTEGHLEGFQAKEKEIPSKPFSSYYVMYKDDKFAFLLKPSLRPSAYYNRKPVARIAKGHTVGIPVQRGFDRDVWERMHGGEKKKAPSQSSIQPASVSAEGQENTGSGVCSACMRDKERGQVTDLVLIAHGIGQKFAERVESFHFTHAVNAFRREMNIELGSPAVKSVLREDQNGIMVLPVNWRHTLSFEDGGPMREEDREAYTPGGFSLKDIEPTSIPAVRSMISDVMFDIPFYMSHHKRKMIEGLVTEANRVYRLWCQNNPGFAKKGRVHLIGHSLGSAMCIEVLSRQPTVPPPLDLNTPHPQSSFFEFDTKNLFLLGSPAGFFLLLEKGALLPRRDRAKPGADPHDASSPDVTGVAGTFGCLAVDNVYNILAKEDPIAYLLNGTIDVAYAASLKVAYVPSAALSIFKSMGDAMRNLVPGMSPAMSSQATATVAGSGGGIRVGAATGSGGDELSAKVPPHLTARLPSQLELEVHDFTREEIAEKKAYLLNDNGQVDYYLRSGGGPLEMQYLNMLSAHTSYWANQDLIRMLCIEIGREPGRDKALQSLKAAKTTERIAASLMGH